MRHRGKPWCPRQAAAPSSLFHEVERQVELQQPVDEHVAMLGVWAVADDGVAMLACSVALVTGPVVMRSAVVHGGHDRVAVHLGDDRRSGYCRHQVVALDQAMDGASRVDAQPSVAAIAVRVDEVDKPAKNL